MSKIFILIISSLLFSIADSSDETNTSRMLRNKLQYEDNQIPRETQTKVNVTVFYESLCPESIEFILTQLEPVSKTLEDYIDIKMIPFGNAFYYVSPQGRYYFQCQHGPDECYGNKLQACGIDQFGNSTKAVTFNACMLKYTKKRKGLKNPKKRLLLTKKKDGMNFMSALRRCSAQQSIQPYDILRCARTDHGSVLLLNYGIETQRVYKKYVPYVLLNDSEDHEDEATDNLMKLICRMLQPTPKVCEEDLESTEESDEE